MWAKKPSVELAQLIPEANYLGRMNVVCKHCQALHWDAEKLSSSTKANIKFGTLCCKVRHEWRVYSPLASITRGKRVLALASV